MKTKFQLHIAFSLLLVYVISFGVSIHDVIADSFSENTFKKQTTHKSSKNDSPIYYAYQDIEIIGHTPTDSEIADVFPETLIAFKSFQDLNPSKTAQDSQYLKAGRYIIPSYNIQACIFPFHDFI